MTKYLKILIVSVLATLTGCAHNIQIAPQLDNLRSYTPTVTSELNVGYFISPEDKDKQVITPGGGSDKIAYFPYKDSEGALNTVLSKVYRKVYSVPSLNERDFLTQKQIAFIFKPQITTTSSSNSAFTWPPTDFQLTLSCIAADANGKEIWSETVTGQGHAEFSEFKNDFPLAARRATEDAFKKLQHKIISSPMILQK